MVKLNRKTSQAFTLIEVLIAMVIIAIALYAVMQAFARQTSDLDYLRQRNIASWVAENIDAKLRAHLLKDTRQGVSEFAGRQWLWRIKESPIKNSHLLKVTIRVLASRSQQQYAKIEDYLTID